MSFFSSFSCVVWPSDVNSAYHGDSGCNMHKEEEWGLVEEGAVGPDQGGLHTGAAHIKGDDMSHRASVPRRPMRGLVHCAGLLRSYTKQGEVAEARSGWCRPHDLM